MRRVWLVVWVLLVATAASAEPIAVQVFSPGEGSAYDDYLKRLTGVIKARYPGKYEFHERLSVGSDDNYRKVRDAGNGIALVQEDVVRHYVELIGSQAKLRYPVRALGRPFHEVVHVVAPKHIEKLSDVRSISVGPAFSGSAFTFNELRRTWQDFHAVQREIVPPSRGFDELEKAPGKARTDGIPTCQAAFRVFAPGRFRYVEEPGLHLLPMDEDLRNRIVLNHPVYREDSLRTADGRTVPTLAVDTLLVASAALPMEVAAAAIEVMRQENAIEDLRRRTGPAQRVFH